MILYGFLCHVNCKPLSEVTWGRLTGRGRAYDFNSSLTLSMEKGFEGEYLFVDREFLEWIFLEKGAG